MSYQDIKDKIKDRVSEHPNRKKLTIISQNSNEIIADIERADSPMITGTKLSTELINDIIDEVEGLRDQIAQERGTSITENGNFKETYEISDKADNQNLLNIQNNISKIHNSNGGGSLGQDSSAEKGGSIGLNASTKDGFAGGYNAKTMNGDISIDAIQLGSGTNTIQKSLQVYNDNLYNAETHKLGKSLLDAIYPVGSIYLSISENSPALLFGGSWTKCSEGRVLVGTGEIEPNGSAPDSSSTTKLTYNLEEKINAGLPNITGNANFSNMTNWNQYWGGGALGASSQSHNSKHGGAGNSQQQEYNHVDFNASRSNSIYGQSPTVQPNAYAVNIWKRVL